MDNVELLKAKDAIFRLIGRYCICFLGTNNNYYMSDYFDYAIERSFDVLGFDRDEVPLMDFCQAWEDNNRKLWAINSPDEEYRGSTARDYYNIFVKSYKRWADAYYDDTEYINREVLKNDIAKSTEPFNTGSVFRAINRQIAADVVPVVHGRWIRPHWKNNNYCCNCSECGGEAMHRNYQWNKNDIYPICPNCGARMDGGDSDEAD